MNKDQLRGKLQNLKGRAKEAAGAITGNKETQADGFAQRVDGAVREKIGEAKSKLKRNLDKSLR